MNYSDLITLILTQLRTHVNSDQFLEGNTPGSDPIKKK